MSELDQKWAEAVITALPHLNVAHQGPTCTCGGLITIDGVEYQSINARCAKHGVKSHYGARRQERSRSYGKVHAGHRSES